MGYEFTQDIPYFSIYPFYVNNTEDNPEDDSDINPSIPGIPEIPDSLYVLHDILYEKEKQLKSDLYNKSFIFFGINSEGDENGVIKLKVIKSEYININALYLIGYKKKPKNAFDFTHKYRVFKILDLESREVDKNYNKYYFYYKKLINSNYLSIAIFPSESLKLSYLSVYIGPSGNFIQMSTAGFIVLLIFLILYPFIVFVPIYFIFKKCKNKTVNSSQIEADLGLELK